MRRLEIEQQNEAWLEWRQGGIGGSDVAAIVNISKWQTRKQLLAQKAKTLGSGKVRVTNSKKSPAMMRGIELEPKVRDLYIALTGNKVRPACVIHDEYSWMRASLDGLNDDNTLPVEIKVINDLDHNSALGGTVPTKYWPQVQHQLGVTGCKLLHYVSWSDSRKFRLDEQVALVNVRPNAEYIRYLIEEEERFLKELSDLVGKDFLKKE